MKTYLLLFFICVANALVAQNIKTLSYTTIDSIMKVHLDKGSYQAAIPYTEEAKKRSEADFGRMDSVYAYYTDMLGLLYDLSGAYRKGEKLYLEAKDIVAKVLGKKHRAYAKSLNNLAAVYYYLEEYGKCEGYYKEAIAVFASTVGEKHRSYADAVYNLAIFYSTIGQLAKAERMLLRTHRIYKEISGDASKDQVEILSNLSEVYRTQGRLDEAEVLLLEVKEMAKQVLGDKHPHYASILNKLANFYMGEEKYEEAEPLLLQAMSILEPLIGELHPRYATSCDNLASCYVELRQFSLAESYSKKALSIRKKVLGKTHPVYSKSLNNLAHVYLKMGKAEKGGGLLQEMITVAKKNNFYDRMPLGAAYHNLAAFYASAALYDKAIVSYNNALEIYREIGLSDRARYSKSLSGLADVYYLKKEFEPSEQLYLQSLASNCAGFEGTATQWKLEDLLEIDCSGMEVLIVTLKGLHDVARAKYDSTGDRVALLNAQTALKVAMQKSESYRKSFSGGKNKLRVLRRMNEVAQLAMSTNQLLGKEEEQYLKQAFQFSEQNKSILLADAFKGNRARNLGDLPDSLALLEEQLQAEKEKIKLARQKATSEEAQQAMTEQENKINQKIDAFLKSIKDKYPKYHALKYENITASTEEVQALLDEQTLFLEYFVGKKAIYLFVIEKENIELLALPINQKKLRTKVARLRKALSGYSLLINKKKEAYNLYTSSAYWFYEQLLSKALADKTATNLVIVTDGVLGHVPFEAFLTKAAANQDGSYKELSYLLNQYTISYNYSATLWKANKASKRGRSNGKILACAATYPPSKERSKITADSMLAKRRTPYTMNLRTLLEPLPAAQSEVAILEELFSGEFLMGDATNEHFFKSNAGQYGIIHLAMHGILNEHTPILSSLAFTENKDTLEDNFLQAYEISKLDLNADLVVLSACETGYGKFTQGEGVMSLARSFMYAGVPSLVVSLWQVNDQSTAMVMQSFYKYLAAGKAKDEALRQAKLDYIQKAGGVLGHPAFWSPFIQLGDATAVEIKKKGNLWPWVVGGGVLLLLMGGLYLLRKRT